MAIQNFLSGGYYGKLGDTVGQQETWPGFSSHSRLLVVAPTRTMNPLDVVDC